MILSFADKETEKIFEQKFSKKLPQSIQRIALRKLIMIDNAENINDLRIPPANLFYSTGIPTVVLVLKKNKENKDVLFIDASKNFEKGKNQNVLRKEDIDKIIDTYKERKDVDKYAHVATIDEIKENDYNLNIPRYVDTFEPEPPVDLGKLTKEMEETQKEIKQTQSELLGMMKELTSKDEKTQNDLNEFIKMLENEVKRNG